MIIRLSQRLQAAADFVPGGSVLVDIGTDHAYLPICLVQTGRISGAVAADVREGPLLRAREHIAAAGLTGRIHTCLSDGLASIPPDAGDVLSICGMGGMLMIRILRCGDLSGFETFVLAPQSDPAYVRGELMQLGLCIKKETLVYEDGKYYPVLCAVHGADSDDDPVRLRYGKGLLPQAFPVLQAYLAREFASLTAAMEQIMLRTPEQRKPAAQARCRQLQDQIRLNRTALERIGQERL